MITKKIYLGVSLIFAYKDKNVYEVEKRHYLLRIMDLNELFEITSDIGSERARRYKKDSCQYWGIYDIFEVNNPLRNAGILGRTSYWSYKDVKSAEKLLGFHKEFGIFKFRFKSLDDFYMCSLIYFLGHPEEFKNRRTILFNVLVKTKEKKDKIINNAVHLAESKSFLRKLTEILQKYEKKPIKGNLNFIGISDIQFIPEKINVGNCFASEYKPYKNISSIRRLIQPKLKVSEKFEEVRKFVSSPMK